MLRFWRRTEHVSRSSVASASLVFPSIAGLHINVAISASGFACTRNGSFEASSVSARLRLTGSITIGGTMHPPLVSDIFGGVLGPPPFHQKLDHDEPIGFVRSHFEAALKQENSFDQIHQKRRGEQKNSFALRWMTQRIMAISPAASKLIAQAICGKFNLFS